MTPPQPPPRGRSFRLGDALISVAAVGIIVALYRNQPYRAAAFAPIGWTLTSVSLLMRTWVGFLTPGLATFTLALLAMRFLPPRPALPRLTRFPGTTALLAASLVMAVDLAVIIIQMFAGILVGFPGAREEFLTLVGGSSYSYVFATDGAPGHPDPRQVGLAVAACWFVQLLARRWRTEPHWLDRSGRVLGIAWIALMLVAWFA